MICPHNGQTVGIVNSAYCSRGTSIEDPDGDLVALEVINQAEDAPGRQLRKMIMNGYQQRWCGRQFGRL